MMVGEAVGEKAINVGEAGIAADVVVGSMAVVSENFRGLDAPATVEVVDPPDGLVGIVSVLAGIVVVDPFGRVEIEAGTVVVVIELPGVEELVVDEIEEEFVDIVPDVVPPFTVVGITEVDVTVEDVKPLEPVPVITKVEVIVEEPVISDPVAEEPGREEVVTAEPLTEEIGEVGVVEFVDEETPVEEANMEDVELEVVEAGGTNCIDPERPLVVFNSYSYDPEWNVYNFGTNTSICFVINNLFIPAISFISTAGINMRLTKV
ncbi:hypothetical protein B7494_g980 [Chlorociboria aeruginascens]|nr:hypothetical protein B7494_g980 [Chlorociboria aeruginascens]